METFRLGKTNLTITRTGFGALPIQRVSFDAAAAILRRAYDAGITFFDTARAYSDSEEKIGYALADVRRDIVIATKSGATTYDGIMAQLETSLTNMKTDYVDIMQLHNPAQLPDPADSTSSYAALVKAKEQGMIRHIGITNHRLAVAREAVESGLYDTLQFPLSAISNGEDLALIPLCKEHDVGLIAMKAMCGGILSNARMAFTFLHRFDNVVPIWGCQKLRELEEFLALDADPPAYDDEIRALVAKDKEELAGNFCRACGYCLPCPAEIPIPMAARITYCLGRMPTGGLLSPEFREKMLRIEDCVHCGQCHERCPYDINAEELLPDMLEAYEEAYAAAR